MKKSLTFMIFSILSFITIPLFAQQMPFTCHDIANVTYEPELDSTQSISLVWGDHIGYGAYTKNRWQDMTEVINWPNAGVNVGLDPVYLSMTDNHLVESDYPGGIMEITCENGESVKIYIPDFKDIEGSGFKSEDGTEFEKLHIAADGTTYYDQELTQLAGAPAGYQQPQEQISFDKINYYVSLLDHKNPKVRENAIIRLNILAKGDEKIFTPIAKRLEDESADIRFVAVNALAKFQTTESLKVLIEALEKETSEKVISNIQGAIMLSEVPNSSDLLLKNLKAGNDLIKEVVMFPLGKMKVKEALPLLLDALDSDNYLIRIRAVDALKYFDDNPEVKAALEKYKNTKFKEDFEKLF